MKAKVPSIHYYDTDTGYIHYVSSLLPPLECKVYDAVRKMEDVIRNSAEAIKFIPQLNGYSFTEIEIRTHLFSLSQEAVAVSKKGIRFMDNVMKQSPLREGSTWLNEPDGRKAFLEARQVRRRLWLADLK